MTESTNEYKKRIEEIKQSIENEPYMAKMREDIAEGISKTGIRQANVEEQFQSVLDETTGKDVISAPEIILARDGATTLGERLEEDKAEVTAQLAQTTNHLSGSHLNTETYISFMDDDFGNDRIMDWMIDLFKTENIPLNVAIIGYQMEGDQAKIDRARRVEETGGNVTSHTFNHVNLATETNEQVLRDEIIGYFDFLNSLGFDENIMVYPYGASSPLSRKIVREVSDFAIGTREGINDKRSPFKNYNLKRISGIGEPNSSLQYCKDKVLEAKVSGGWLIFKQHAKNDWTEQTKADLVSLIQFIKTQGIKIVSVKEGFEKKKNPIDVESEEGDFFTTSQYGLVDWSELYWRNNLNTNKLDIKGSKLDFDTPITSYEYGTTNMYYRNKDLGLGKGEPVSNGGVLQTYRPIEVDGDGDFGAYQIYLPYNSNNVYKRRWSVNGSTWEDWVQIIRVNETVPFVVNSTKEIDNNTPITDFPKLSCSIHNFNFNDEKGFPTKFGTLKTYRVNADNGSIQEFTDGSSNITYQRTWYNKWTSWGKRTQQRKYVVEVDFGEVPAMGVSEITVPLTGAKKDNSFIINPANGITSTLLYFISSTDDDSVRIKLFNTANKPITMTRYFNIRELY